MFVVSASHCIVHKVVVFYEMTGRFFVPSIFLGGVPESDISYRAGLNCRIAVTGARSLEIYSIKDRVQNLDVII